MKPERATPPPLPESNKETPRLAISAASESRVSKGHPDYNEDAALGDLSRILTESTKEIPLKTADVAGDTAAIREAGKLESANAKALRDLGVHAVFDGVSGDQNGAGMVASRIAAGRIAERLGKLPKEADPETTRRAIVDALRAAHKEVSAHRGERADVKSMSTTADVARVMKGENGKGYLAYGHVGDSVIYVRDGKTGKVRLETVEDSAAQILKRRGLISEQEHDALMAATSKDELPEKLKKFYSVRKQLGSAIGFDNSGEPELPVASGIVELNEGDQVLLGSDGFENLSAADIERILNAGGGIKELIAEAGAVADGGKVKNRLSKVDDITGTLIKYGEEEKGLELDITIEDEEDEAAKKKAKTPPPLPPQVAAAAAAAKKARAEEKARMEARDRDLLLKIQKMIREEIGDGEENGNEKAA